MKDNKIDIIDNISILAKLDLSEDEREIAKKDIEEMLGFIDKMNELDTKDVEPLLNGTGLNNVFRDDVVINEDVRDDMLKNAPSREGEYFKVPKTI